MAVAVDVTKLQPVANASGVLFAAYNPETGDWCGITVAKLAEALAAHGGLGAGQGGGAGLPAGGGPDKVLGWDPALNDGAGGAAWQGSAPIDGLPVRVQAVNNAAATPITMEEHGNSLLVLLGTGPLVFDWGATGDGFLCSIRALAGDVPFSVTGTGTTKVLPDGASLSRIKGGDKYGVVVEGFSADGATHFLTFAGPAVL